MVSSLKINGQRWNLEATPDLLYEILVSITNVEEKLNSLDKRLSKIEKPRRVPYIVKRE